MDFPRRHHFKRRDKDRHRERPSEPSDSSLGMHNHINPEHTGSESDYLKSLVDSRAKVTVVLKTGERLQGRIRYYDRYCFSLGLSGQGPRLFLRKASVSYISEE
jgi:sRNA-binding regulator protein Hfq